MRIWMHPIKALVFLFWLTLPFAAHAGLQFTELMPDPTGDDGAEWFELYNSTSQPISSAGWKLVVNGRTTTLPAHEIPADGYLVFTKSQAKFTLTNTGASASLLDPLNNRQDSITYTKAPEGRAYARLAAGWGWTSAPTPGKPNLAGWVNAVKSIAPTSAARVSAVADVYTAKSGTPLTVEGTVTLAPGELGDNIMFLDGLQLNLTGGTWPVLSTGDKVHISGSTSHTKSYGTRLTVKADNEITMIKQTTPLEPLLLKLSEIDHNLEGKLVTVSGTVSKVSPTSFSLDEGDARLSVSLKNRELSWPKLTVDDAVQITGFITLSDSEPKLWARSPQDIIITRTLPLQNQATTINLASENDQANWPGYAVLGGLVIFLITTYLWQRKQLPTPSELIKKYLRQFRPKK